MADLGEIVRIPIREVFPNEEYDFTKHFENSKNLSKLGEALGIPLELIETESRVGRYEADIFAKSDSRSVVVENQYGFSDHDHFGKLMTYVSGKEADIGVWIVERARDEHRKLISDLNKKSDYDLFLVEVKIIAVVDPKTGKKSAPCVDYDVVEAPNEFVKETEETKKAENNKFKPFWNKFEDAREADSEFAKEFSFNSPNKGYMGMKCVVKNSDKNVWFCANLNNNEVKAVIVAVKDFYDSNLAGFFDEIAADKSIERSRHEIKTYYAENAGYRKNDEIALAVSVPYSFKDESTWSSAILKTMKNFLSMKAAVEKKLS